MGVLGIMNTALDAVANPDTAVIVTDTTKFDATVTDMAWHLVSRSSGTFIFDLPHDVAAGDITWYHMALTGVRQEGADDGGLFKIFDASNGEIMWMRLTDGYLRIRLPGSVDSQQVSLGEDPRLMRLDIMIDFTGAGLEVTLYIEGSETKSLSIFIASSGALTAPAKFQVYHTDSDHTYISELYVADFDTRNTRPVKQTIDAVGALTDWTGAYTDVNDDDVATEVLSDVNAEKFSANVIAYPGPATSGGINRVVAKIRATKGTTGPTEINPLVRIASTNYNAGNIGPTTTVEVYYPEWSTNPNTGVGWVSADLNTTEIGVEAVT